MFHKFAISLNCFLLALPWFVYYLTTVFTALRPQFSLTNILLVLSFLILSLFFSFIFIIIASLVTHIKVGKPPIGSSTIAYKYGLSDTVTGSAILRDQLNFPNNDKIHICYERKVSQDYFWQAEKNQPKNIMKSVVHILGQAQSIGYQACSCIEKRHRGLLKVLVENTSLNILFQEQTRFSPNLNIFRCICVWLRQLSLFLVMQAKSSVSLIQQAGRLNTRSTLIYHVKR